MPLPGSWLYRLRRKRATARGGAAAEWASEPGSHQQAPMAAPPPCSPNRASYYFPSRDRRLPSSPVKDNHRLRDTHFPRSPQPGDIVFDVVAVSAAAARRADRFDGLKAAPPELKLRPILTRPATAAGDASLAPSPTARVRRLGRRKLAPPPEKRRRRRWLYESVVVVKESADPEEDFVESMAEMIAEHDDVRSPRGLEELLACYLTLNDAGHHRAIVAAFRRAWLGAAAGA